MKFVALAGLGLAALGWLLQPPVFASAWLACLVVWLGWPLGSLLLLQVHRLTGGAWGAALMPGLLLGVRAVWLLPVAVLPLLLNHGWAHLPVSAIRGVLYLVIWLGLGGLALRGPTSGPAVALGIVALVLSMSFAAIEVTHAVQPGVYSGAAGLVAIAGWVAFAVAAAVLVAANAAPPALLGGVGGLLLGAALLSGYFATEQFLIVVESDLPTDAPWYVPRLAGGWLAVAVGVSLLLLALPVLTLAVRPLRGSAPVLTALAVLLIAGAVLRGWWVVLPAVPRGLSWIDGACLLAFAAGSLALPRGRAGAPQRV